MISWVFLGMNESLKPKTKSKAIRKEPKFTQLKYQELEVAHSGPEMQNFDLEEEKNV